MRPLTCIFLSLFVVGCVVDKDEDGHRASEDCDDKNASVNPGANETCDGIDNDCDGDIDEDLLSTWYADTDTDAFGDPDSTTDACSAPSGYVADNTDCDDAKETVFPGADEYCNEVDDNCNGAVDEDPVDATEWFLDNDGDGYGTGTPIESCNPAFGGSDSGVATHTPGLDIWDHDAIHSPIVLTGCGFIANVTVDVDITHEFRGDLELNLLSPSGTYVRLWYDHGSDATDLSATFTDAATNPLPYDTVGPLGETLPDEALSNLMNEPSAGEWQLVINDDFTGDEGALNSWGLDITCQAYISAGGDCDDTAVTVNPGATEICNGIDDNCDSAVDDSTAADATTWYEDKDSDGYGDPNTTPVVACSAPAFFDAPNGEDCDDTNAIIHPGMDETCNQVDDNCDGEIDEDTAVDASTWHIDSDSDGYGDSSLATITACSGSGSHTTSSSGDCDDTDSAINPGAADLCGDEIDNDCSGAADESGAAFEETNGTWSDLSTGLTGTPTSAAVFQFSSEGTAYFCPGTHYVSLVVDADVTITGTTGVATDVVLDGANSTHVLLVQPSNLPSVELHNLTVANGNSSYGGNIHCSATPTTPASLVLVNTVVQGGVSANEGGAIYAYNCDITLLNSTLENNSAVDGGGIYLWNSNFLAETSVLTNNSATNGGGGIYVLNQDAGAPKYVYFLDSEVSGNSAVFGGGLALVAQSTSSIDGLSSCAGGGSFTQNTASVYGGAIYLEGYPAVPGLAEWQSTGCDYGAPGTSSDNSPNDVYVFDSATDWSYGAGAVFTCDSGSTNSCTGN